MLGRPENIFVANKHDPVPMNLQHLFKDLVKTPPVTNHQNLIFFDAHNSMPAPDAAPERESIWNGLKRWVCSKFMNWTNLCEPTHYMSSYYMDRTVSDKGIWKPHYVAEWLKHVGELMSRNGNKFPSRLELKTVEQKLRTIPALKDLIHELTFAKEVDPDQQTSAEPGTPSAPAANPVVPSQETSAKPQAAKPSTGTASQNPVKSQAPKEPLPPGVYSRASEKHRTPWQTRWPVPSKKAPHPGAHSRQQPAPPKKAPHHGAHPGREPVPSNKVPHRPYQPRQQPSAASRTPVRPIAKPQPGANPSSNSGPKPGPKPNSDVTVEIDFSTPDTANRYSTARGWQSPAQSSRPPPMHAATAARRLVETQDSRRARLNRLRRCESLLSS